MHSGWDGGSSKRKINIANIEMLVELCNLLWKGAKLKTMGNRKNSRIVGIAITCLIIGSIFVGIGLVENTLGDVTDMDTDITIEI
jgi:hypothetical protein